MKLLFVGLVFAVFLGTLFNGTQWFEPLLMMALIATVMGCVGVVASIILRQMSLPVARDKPYTVSQHVVLAGALWLFMVVASVLYYYVGRGGGSRG